MATKWTGNCYEAAAVLIIDCWMSALGKEDLSNYRLVHGYPVGRGVENEGRRYGHAWVEAGDEVYDWTVSHDPMPKELYYALGRLTDQHVYRYTFDEMRERMNRHEHYGPWEGPEGVERLPRKRRQKKQA